MIAAPVAGPREIEEEQVLEHGSEEMTARLAELLTRASWRLRRNERKELAPFGLTFAQARALRALAKAGPMRIGDLAALLEIVPRSATSRVDDLEKAGLVSRDIDPGDRRSILVAATLQGEELVERLKTQRQVSAGVLFAPLGGEGRSQLLHLLETLTDLREA